METEEKYIISIGVLAILLIINFIIICMLVGMATDLRDKVQMQENTIGVCNIDLEEVQKENEELRKELLNK